MPFVVAVLVAAFFAGAVPFSNLVARRARRVDLRSVGGGTVSGTAVYRVAGFGPLAVARGTAGAWAGAAVLMPMIVKRLAGNAPQARRTVHAYAHRLGFDNDGPGAP